MSRKSPKIDTWPKVTEITPRFFWRECALCRSHFRNERAYRVALYSALKWRCREEESTEYVCQSCAPSPDDNSRDFWIEHFGPEYTLINTRWFERGTPALPAAVILLGACGALAVVTILIS